MYQEIAMSSSVKIVNVLYLFFFLFCEELLFGIGVERMVIL